ncbi:hypothetical protein Hanom_Chr12g01111641 [Helianthus anomalus]
MTRNGFRAGTFHTVLTRSISNLFDANHFDAYRFDVNRFDAYRFDPYRFDPYRFDPYRFDANRFGPYRFESNRFDANRLAMNRFSTMNVLQKVFFFFYKFFVHEFPSFGIDLSETRKNNIQLC